MMKIKSKFEKWRIGLGRYEGEMLDGQPHGNGSIVYMANDKFGRANYTGIFNILEEEYF